MRNPITKSADCGFDVGSDHERVKGIDTRKQRGVKEALEAFLRGKVWEEQ